MTDWILRGGEVVDGSGRPRRRADVAIAGDRIAAVGVVGKVAGAREIDVTGKIVAPALSTYIPMTTAHFLRPRTWRPKRARV